MNEVDLLARVASLEDRLTLIELEGAYARAFDSRAGEEWAALFTKDGVYQARDATPEAGNYVAGREALADFCTNAPFDGIHLMHLPQITVAGDTASSRVHLEFLGVFHTDGRPTVRMTGYYDVRYARIDGRWFIDRRVTTTMLREDRQNLAYQPESAFDRG